MGREHDVGGLSHGTVSRHRLEHPHRGPHRDRTVADPDRGRAAAGAPTAVQLAAGALVAAAGRLPLPLALWLGRRLGDAAYVALGRRRRLALDNLARAYPALPLRARARLDRHARRPPPGPRGAAARPDDRDPDGPERGTARGRLRRLLRPARLDLAQHRAPGRAHAHPRGARLRAARRRRAPQGGDSPRAAAAGGEWRGGRRRRTDGTMYERHRARHPRGPRAVALVARPLAYPAARRGARAPARRPARSRARLGGGLSRGRHADAARARELRARGVAVGRRRPGALDDGRRRRTLHAVRPARRALDGVGDAFRVPGRALAEVPGPRSRAVSAAAPAGRLLRGAGVAARGGHDARRVEDAGAERPERLVRGSGGRPGTGRRPEPLSRRPTRNTALLLRRLFLRLRRLLRSGRGADGHRRHLPAFIHVADADLVTRREVLGGDVLAGLPDLRLVADGEGPLRLLALRLARHHDAVGAGRLDRAHRRVMRGLLLHLLHLLLFRLHGRRRRLGAGEPGAGEHERDPYECSKRSLHGDSSWVVCCRWNLGLGPVGALPPSIQDT